MLQTTPNQFLTEFISLLVKIDIFLFNVSLAMAILILISLVQ